MKKSLIFSLVVIGFVFSIIRDGHAFTLFLNFDTELDGDPIATGTLINTAYSPALTGVTFGADDTIVGPVTTASPPNFAIGNPFDFSSPLDASFSGFVDLVSVQNATNSGFTLTAFLNNVIVDTVSCGFSIFPCLAIVESAGGIDRIQVTTNSQYAIDDFTVRCPNDDTCVGAATVPEPSTLLLIASGLVGLLGARGRSLSR